MSTSRLGPCGCRQDNEDAINDLQQMIHQLQADVDNLSRANEQLSDELNGHRSELEVTPLILSSRSLQQLLDFTQRLCTESVLQNFQLLLNSVTNVLHA